MSWIPWLPPIKNLFSRASSGTARSAFPTSPASSAAPKPSKPPAVADGTETAGDAPTSAASSAPHDEQHDVATKTPSQDREAAAMKSTTEEDERTTSLVQKTSPTASRPKQILLRSFSKSASASSSSTSNESGIQPPKLVHSVRPVAPPEALRNFVTGNVTVEVTVDSTGRVKGAKALSGPEVLRKAAVNTVKQYRYQPATENGKPVPAHVQVTLQFWYEP
jgi:protein TonB